VERREEVYRAYWHLACERQAIFERRMRGEPAPWTRDEILRTYKFTNPWRASDRVTQFLIRDVIYDDTELPAEDVLARIVLFRLFSRPATWRALEARLGPFRAATLASTALPKVLEELRARGPIYTGAFILCANRAYGYERKYMNHIALVRAMLSRGSLPRAVASAVSLRDLYQALVEFPLIGPFMAYQLAIDINYSELTDFSEDEFTVPGPGAERGIRKVFPQARRRDMTGLIMRMVAEQDNAVAEPPLLFGRRRLHAIDCQNLFCELDKYARVRFPELRSNRTRIKTRFTPTPEPLRLFYPPKWRIPVPARSELRLAV
jgi:alpha-glutamyl/putrescinyl thymine pyrophosphorylase clade 1